MKIADTLPILKQNAAVDFPSDMTIGGAAVSALGTVTSTSATALVIGANGATNPVFSVNANTGSVATGLTVIGAAAAGGVALNVLSSGANENLIISPKGTGLLVLDTVVQKDTPTAVNTTATLTVAQVVAGYITSTSAGAVTMTLPTGTDLGTALGAVQGTTMDLFIDNTAGSTAVTLAVSVNGIKSDAAATTAASFGQMTVANGVTGIGCFRLMFSSATAFVFTRIA